MKNNTKSPEPAKCLPNRLRLQKVHTEFVVRIPAYLVPWLHASAAADGLSAEQFIARATRASVSGVLDYFVKEKPHGDDDQAGDALNAPAKEVASAS